MAIVYFDSSALVKLLVEESGSDVAAALWDGCDAAVSSRLSYLEVCAALAAAGRNHDLDQPEPCPLRTRLGALLGGGPPR
ncbi:MAG: type II toxin-antitoxin system VapC family toxin [Acidimicrobiaceae bacterium]|nr:type II toxin-antitoxin system VapC family toxin [Acidimicrobiaceae bacterium]